MEEPHVKTRMRWLATIALLGLLGMVAFVLLAFLLAAKVIPIQGEMELIVSIALIFSGALAILSAIAGLLMKREIDRRL